MVKWIQSMTIGAKSIDSLKSAQESLNEAFKDNSVKKAVSDIQEMKTVLDMAKRGVIDKDRALKFFNNTLGKVIGNAKNLNEAEQLLVRNGEAYIKMTLYKAAAEKARDKQAEELLKEEEARMKSIEEYKSSSDRAWINFGFDRKDWSNTNKQYEMQQRFVLKKAEERKNQEIKNAQESALKQKKIVDNFMKKAEAEAKKLNLTNIILGDTPKEGKAKKYSGASLTGEQRDALMDMEAKRDILLAMNEELFYKGLKTEKEYLQRNLEIITEFHDKKIAYLKAGNAKERQLEARARVDREKEIKETQKKIFELDYKQNEDLYKQRQNQLETQSKELENIDYLTDLQRLKKQVELDNQMISEADKYWNNQLSLARSRNQDLIEIERKRDEELNKLQLNRNQRLKAMPGALRSEFESRNAINANIDEANYEAERGRIERNRELSDRQRSLELSRLELAYTINRLNKERQTKSELFASLSLKAQMGTITQKEAEELSKIRVDLEKSNNELQKAERNLNSLDFKFIVEGLSPLVDLIKSGFNDLGLDNIANQFTSLYDKLIKEGKEFKLTNEEIFKAAAAVIADFSNQLIENQKNRTIAALDEQLTYSQQKTEQEIGFIQSRLEYLNNLQDATEEQIVERNRLEDEARALREQQEMREKMIAKQKARAMQKAQAQQALIAGFQGAILAYLSQLIPGVPSSIIRAQIAAAATLGFAALQSALIMSKDPVPQYYVGRDGGKAEWAYTQEKGREIITDKHGNIKSLGHDKGATMTWLDEGDKVYTAEETKKLLQNMDNAEIGTKLFRKIAREGSAMPIFVNNQPDNSDKIIKGVGSEFERVIRKYDKTNAYRNENGDLVIERGNRIPEVRRVKKEKINIIINNKNERD